MEDDKIKDLYEEIERYTLEIEQSFPELYRFLDESQIKLTLESKSITFRIAKKPLGTLSQF